jgi:prepilin-type N-terminal cleavage/methylation domain-containing protein
MNNRSFTLVELIIVVIIVGILASLGLDQYSKTVEKSRCVEAKTILGDMRKFAYEYWLQNGTFVGISSADFNIGTASSQIPSQCTSTHYFSYTYCCGDSTQIALGATRCSSGGKAPQASGDAVRTVGFWVNPNGGSGWGSDGWKFICPCAAMNCCSTGTW